MKLEIKLPELSEEMGQRFEKINQRPVVLKVNDLSKVFESAKGSVQALKDINFEVRRREFISVVGPSGCGKSTLIRIIAGLESQTEGEMLLDGKPASGPCAERGMVFQGYTLFPWLTVKQNVMFGLKMNGKSNLEASEKSLQWIDFVGLDRFADSYPNELSGGMKQRVAIARALANQPRILLMDEPFGALDAQTRNQMQTHLLKIWENVDVTILFITHDLDEAVYMSDRIIVLSANPGQVHEIIKVPVPRPRDRDQMIDTIFLDTKLYLESLIHPPNENMQKDISKTMFRMTQVGDDIY